MKKIMNKLMSGALGLMGGFAIFAFTISAVYYPGKFVWNAFHGAYDAKILAIVLLTWIAANLILYQIISAVIAYVWHYRNRKNFVLHASPEERKRLKRRFGVATDEELDSMEEKPSILATILFNSSHSLSIIRNFLVDGPHIPYMMNERYKTTDGIIRSRNFFDFAVMRGESDNIRFLCLIFHPRYLPYAILSGILGYLSITFWCLIPFTRAAVGHYRMLNDFVSDFSPYAAIRIKHSQTDADIEHIQKLHDMIWNKLPLKEYFEDPA